MNDELYQDDERDCTIFIEYYPTFVLSSAWNNDGSLWFYKVESIA